jgi:hypothetical protein
MSVIGITDRLTARVLLADGHRVLLHARTREQRNSPRKHGVATSPWWLANRAVQIRLHSLCPLPEELGHRGRYGTRV